MATTISNIKTLQSICKPSIITSHSSSRDRIQFSCLRKTHDFCESLVMLRKTKKCRKIGTRIQAVEKSSVVEVEQEEVVAESPPDLLTMFFQAEGTMSEVAIPSLTKALMQIEGIANLKVQVVEAIASVELTKQTTMQATGVASSLVELIQGSGFRLQTLNLSFVDEEDVAV